MLRTSASRLAALSALIVFSLAQAQTGHPAKGTWLGHWGPDAQQQRRVVILLDWRNQALGGTLNPGPRSTKIEKATIDYDSWTLTIEGNLVAKPGEAPQKWVATGKLENLGSWTNRRYSGTYQFGGESGRFTTTLN